MPCPILEPVCKQANSRNWEIVQESMRKELPNLSLKVGLRETWVHILALLLTADCKLTVWGPGGEPLLSESLSSHGEWGSYFISP